MNIYVYATVHPLCSSVPEPVAFSVDSENLPENAWCPFDFRNQTTAQIRPVTPGTVCYESWGQGTYTKISGGPIDIKKINKGFGKVNPGKFGLKGPMNTDAVEQLINDGKRFFLTAGGQQLLNNILSGVS